MINVFKKKEYDGNVSYLEHSQKTVGAQLGDYICRIGEEWQREESNEDRESKIYAKLQAGKKLSPGEMHFLARTNPELYHKALRIQNMRKAFEKQLKSCKSKQEAKKVYSITIESIGEDDPDKEALIAAIKDVYKEFKESDFYKTLPETPQEKGGTRSSQIKFDIGENGYQEIYVEEENENLFRANG